MALTGTGTKADPLIVHTIEELYDACRYTNPDVSFDDSNKIGYIEVANDLDFNDAPDFKQCPNSFITPNIHLGGSDNNKVSIDFKGHTLSNLYGFDMGGSVIGVRTAHHIRLKNAIIEAVLIDFTKYSSMAIGIGDYTTYPIFDNCDFRIKYYIYSTYSYSSSIFDKIRMLNCVVNIDIFYTSNSYIGEGVKFYPFRGVPSSGSSTDFLDKIYRVWLYNEFNIRFIYIGTSNWSGDTIAIFEGAEDSITFSSIFVTSIANAANPANIEMTSTRRKTFTNCFFIMRNMNQSHKSAFYHNTGGTCSVGGVNFYDNEVCDTIDFSSVTEGTMLSLSTADCKNAAFLENKGFVIAYDGTS
jgi:hypothetical protein